MTIQTKFSLGDTVFFLRRNIVMSGEIKSINVCIDNRLICKNMIEYRIQYKEESGAYMDANIEERAAFISKDDLLKSL